MNYFKSIIILIAIVAVSSCSEPGQTKSAEIATTPTSSKIIKQGEILKTQYFDIVVNSVGVAQGVSTGNEFADLPPKPGIRYLIINTTFKNTDTESRMVMEGSVFITYNGKEYNFDKSETIMAEGWGLMLEQINPLTSITTKLVYSIPDEVKGPAYWNPGRADSDERIYLGIIK